jgi:glycosyltransferase involved in cell wall biosynthesis
VPRILHLGKFFPPFAGGIENFLADLMPAQIQPRNTTIAALVHDHQRQWSRFFATTSTETWNNLTIYRVPTYGRLLYAPVSPQFPVWFNQVLKQFRPQLLHLHLPNTSAFFALGLSRAKRLPWVIHWHADVTSSLNSKLSIAYHAYRPLEQRLLAHAQAIIVTSKPYLASSIPLRPWQDKCQVIPLGIALSRLPEPAKLAQQWAEQQWENSGIRILTVGRLTYYKGHEVLIRAMAQVKGAHLLIIGQGEQQRYLQTLITQLNLANQVKLLGYCSVTELNALLATCDCFCLPSLERTEAFGVALLEAMRYSKPIVASAISGSGVTWVVVNNQTGLLVPPQDEAALAQALQQLIDNFAWRISLGKAGQQRCEQLFNIQIIAEKIAELYQQVLTSMNTHS